MAFSDIPGISVRGISACVPARKLRNAESELLSETERKLLVPAIGVDERRAVEDGACTSDLCFHAAEKLIAELGWDKKEITWLIFVSQSADYVLPATACILQNRLGLPKTCAAMDVSLGCSGWVYGLNTLAALLRTTKGKGLLLVGDTTTRLQYFRDKTSFPLFGDAGTATALEFDENAHGLKFHLGSDGSGFEAIIIPDGGFRNPCSPKSFNEFTAPNGATLTRRHVYMNGMDVFAFAQSQAPKSISALCENFEIDPKSVDLFVLHQANRALNERIRAKLKLPEEKVPSSLKFFGNTSSASIPLTIVSECRSALTKAGTQSKIIASGFGVGLSIASVFFCTKNLAIPTLIEI